MYATLMMRKVVGWVLRDPKIRLNFENRPYRLGETLDLVVEVVANRNMRISEGLIDLLHERRYVENTQKMVPDYRANRILLRSNMMGRQPIKVMIPKRVTETFRDRYLHSSTPFVGDVELSEKSNQTFQTTLEIQPETPPHYGEGETKWVLEVVLVLPNGREVKKGQEVLVSLF